MRLVKVGTVALGLSMFVAPAATAETMPQLLVNFPVTEDAAIQQAFSEHVRASFPKDIRTSTLTALLEMDGFTVNASEDQHIAHFVDAVFPCITNYTLTWGENDYGHVVDMNVTMTHKCV